jgi:chromosome segregation protein
MRVSRLEVFGFKSFMERLVLNVESGVTAVVGPNGCGKSNIVDALRWVMGETKASSLRGSLLEDVIFNGTAKLRPLGLAEVTLTLKSSEKDLFSELLSSKTLLGKAEVERVTDGNEKSAGEADEEYPPLRIVEGGKTEEVIETLADPDNHLQNDNPQSPVSSALASRYSWLKSCSEVQVTRRLYRSGESEYFINRVPCRLKDLKDLLRAVNLGPRAYTIVAQGEVSRVISARPEERRLIIEEAAGVSGFREKIAAARKRLEENSQNLERLDDIINEVTRQLGALKRQAQRAQARKEINERIFELEGDLFCDKWLALSWLKGQVVEQLDSASMKEEELLSGLKKVQAKEFEARNALVEIDVRADGLRSKIDTLREEQESRRRILSEWNSKISELNAFCKSYQAELSSLHDRAEVLRGRKSENDDEVLSLEEKGRDLEQDIGALEGLFKEELRRAREEVEQARQNLKAAEAQLGQVNEAKISASARLESLKEEVLRASPLREHKGAASLLEGASVLADYIEVEPRYRKAIGTLLGQKLNYFISESPFERASCLLEGLRQLGASGGGVDFGVLDPSFCSDFKELQAPFPSLLSVLQADPKVESIVKELLKNTFLCADFKQAVSYFVANPKNEALTLLTPEGEVVTAYSYNNAAGGYNVIELRARVSEAKKALELLAAEQAEKARIKEELSLVLEAKTAAEDETRKKVSANEQEVRSLGSQLGGIRGQLRSLRAVAAQLRGDIEGLKVQSVKLEAKIDQAEKQRLHYNERLSQLEAEAGSSSSSETIVAFQQDLIEIEKERSLARQDLSGLSQELSQQRQSLDDERATLSALNLNLQKHEIELDNLKERFLSEFGASPLEAALARASGFERLGAQVADELKQELFKLRSRVMREGEVDSSAIERFEQENTRLESLLLQRDDLRQAAATLNDTIERLTVVSKQKFLATFEAVKKNFSELIPRLFGGGKGELELTDPQTPLDSGVEIVARPPGKKLKSIELLSGGEKALCATALVFSMFLESPSPLCILDEVDAPLDEANLLRFLSLIRDLSVKTQFIMITHNKQSMASADNLVGVTMEQPGASKMIAVSLKEAYSQVA